MNEQFKDIQLGELVKVEGLSYETYILCKDSKLLSLKDILNYHLKYKTFTSLYGCKGVSASELTNLCLKYTYKANKDEEASVINPIVKDEHVKNNATKINFNLPNLYHHGKDIPLRILAQKEYMSIRAVNVCKEADLFFLSQILDFYKQRGTFKAIRNCGIKSESELVSLCEKYLNGIHSDEIEEGINRIEIHEKNEESNPSTTLLNKEIGDQQYETSNKKYEGKDIPLNILADREDMSIRSINVCKDCGLNTLNQILEFYKRHGTFTTIRNCGRKSEMELTSICEKYLTGQNLNNFELNGNENNLLDKITNLNPFQKAALSRHVQFLLTRLSVRAENGLRKISKNLNPFELLDKIFNDMFNFNNIENIGTKTVKELLIFEREISEFILLIEDIKLNELRREYIKQIIKLSFFKVDNYFDEILNSAFESSGKIKLFKLIKLLVDSDLLIGNNISKIFYFLYYNQIDKKVKLEDIASELKITKERARQIKVKLEDEIQHYFSFISNFVEDDFANYGIEKEKFFQLVDKTISEKINVSEDVDFNILFYGIIFQIFLKKSHTLIGDDEVIFGKRRTQNQQRFKCCYLISNEVCQSFNFELFIENINSQLNDKISESYSLQYDGFLYQFLRNDDSKYLEQIKIICESMLLNEFDLIVNSSGYLEFERNTFKQLYEYFYEILDENSKPMTVEEIEKAMSEKYPEVIRPNMSVRGSLKDSNIFIYFGRTSTYGLKKWESERENLKGGTIRGLVEEYLTRFDTPKHISDIMEYVLKYRPDTNEKSVVTSLKIEERKGFVFFSGNYFGLKSKKYDAESLSFKKAIGSHFKKEIYSKLDGLEIEKFIEYYKTKFGYSEEQIKYFIKKKIAEGIFEIKSENKLEIKTT